MGKKDKALKEEKDFSYPRELWEIWADYADGIDTVLAHQNASLFAVAAHRDVLQGAIYRWALWRQTQPGALSGQEQALIDSVKKALDIK